MGQPGELFAKYHFVLRFAAKESHVMNVLNRMAASPLVVVATSVEMRNEKADQAPVVQLAKASKKGAKTGTAVAGRSRMAARRGARSRGRRRAHKDLREMPHDDRIVLGDESLTVRLEVDVYGFGPNMAEEQGRGGRDSGETR